jgi:RNA polymerase sigma-70 factor (ECF subfamily)
MPKPLEHSRMSDEELLLFYRKTGDNVWLGHLLQRYTMLLLGIAMKYLEDRDAAYDAVQQIFLKSLSQLPAGEINNFKGWLYILMRNHCLQILRDKKHFSGAAVLENLPAVNLDIEALRQQEGDLKLLQQALTQLPEDQRLCIDAFYLQKKSYQQIMDECRFSFAQVKSHIQNGKRKLRILLSPQLRPDSHS